MGPSIYLYDFSYRESTSLLQEDGGASPGLVDILICFDTYDVLIGGATLLMRSKFYPLVN